MFYTLQKPSWGQLFAVTGCSWHPCEGFCSLIPWISGVFCKEKSSQWKMMFIRMIWLKIWSLHAAIFKVFQNQPITRKMLIFFTISCINRESNPLVDNCSWSQCYVRFCVNLVTFPLIYVCYRQGGCVCVNEKLRSIIIFLPGKIKKLNLLTKHTAEVPELAGFAVCSLPCFPLWQDGFSQSSKGILDFLG